jgi:hypothetical protein
MEVKLIRYRKRRFRKATNLKSAEYNILRHNIHAQRDLTKRSNWRF